MKFSYPKRYQAPQSLADFQDLHCDYLTLLRAHTAARCYLIVQLLLEAKTFDMEIDPQEQWWWTTFKLTKGTNPLLHQQVLILEKLLLPEWTGDFNKHVLAERQSSYPVLLEKHGKAKQVEVDMINCFGPF
jgi:hypothetical protein